MTGSTWTPPATIKDLLNDGGPSFMGNSSTSGAKTESPRKIGDEKYQLYSLNTPNGQKVGILLKELGVPFDEHTINIMKGDQFTSGFVEVNPNSKVPAFVDEERDLKIFESGSILMYLADKHQKFIPPVSDVKARTEVINWLMWQMGSAPYFGQFGHFYKYATKLAGEEARRYGISRYGMETQRLLDVLDKQLEKSKSGFVTEFGYSIADIAIYPWVKCVGSSTGYDASEFLALDTYKRVNEWMGRIAERPAVKEGENVTDFRKIM